MSLLSELKRRNVIRVAVAYLVVSWVVLQIGDVVFPALHLPEWTITLVTVLLVLGFVLALVFSWAFELTPEGLKRDDGKAGDPESAHKLNMLTIAAVVVAVAVALWSGMRSPEPAAQVAAVTDSAPPATTPDRPAVTELEASVAVLPFVNMSGNAENEYFSDGLSETLLHMLAQVPELRVAARTSSFQFKGQNTDVRGIASQLGVATILEGSVQRSGDRVRITAQLVRGDDGSHIWSQNFDRTLDDIFVMQDEIAAAVAEALTASLLGTGEREGASSVGGTHDVAAYEAYLQGIEAMTRGTSEGAVVALAKLELAVQLDPAYGMAWVRLTEARRLPARLGTATWESTYGPSLEAARTAVAVAPDLAEAHLALAFADRNAGITAARAEVQRAVELSPNSAEAQSALSSMLASEGRYRDALGAAQRAAILSPLDRDIRVRLAFQKAYVGLFDEAREDFAAMVAEAPGSAELHWMHSNFLLTIDADPVEPIQEAMAAHEISSDFLGPMFVLTFEYLAIGDLDRSDAWLRRVEAISPQRTYDDRASVCLRTGDMTCFLAYADRYIELQRTAGGETDELLRFEAVAAFHRGEYRAALTALIALSDSLESDDSSAPGDIEFYRALTYDALGMTAERDALIAAIGTRIQRQLANGLAPRFALGDRIMLAAVAGDSDATAEAIGRALDQGILVISQDLEHLAFYDGVRDAPAFQAQLDRVRQVEAAHRARLRELGL